MTNSKKVLFLIAITVKSLVLASSGVAQQRQPARGIQPGNAYSVSDIETINTTNGNLMLNIPLASLPEGRGTSPGFTLSLIYNSKLFDKKRENRDDGIPVQIGNPNYHRELLSQTNAGGWRLNIVHRLVLTSRWETETPVPCADSYYLQKNAHIYKLRLVLPDGSETEFRPIGYTDKYGDGYFNVSPFGVQTDVAFATVGGGSASCNNHNTIVNPNGMNYAAADGSGARLFIPNQPQNGAEALRWTLYYPNGKTIEHFPAEDPIIIERITERNGNRVVIRSDVFNGASAVKIVDDVGHYIIVQGNNIYLQGVGGELLQTVISSKDQYVYRRYKTVFDEPDEDPNEANPNPDKVYEEGVIGFLSSVESITLPWQAGSLKYEFTYYAQDSYPTEGNYTQGWGGLKSVTLPSGAKAEYQYSQPAYDTTDEVLKSYVTDKTLTYRENYEGTLTTRQDTWHYDLTDTSATVTAPDGSQSVQLFKSSWTNPSWDSGLIYESHLADGSVVSKNWKTKYLVEAEFTKLPNGLTAIETYDYDLNGNITNVKEYEYYSGSLSRDAFTNKITIPTSGLTLKRETVKEYYNPQISNFDSSVKLKGLLKSTEIRNGSGTPVSRSEMLYDDENNTGNLTQTKSWDSTKVASLPSTVANGFKLDSSNSISTTTQYDEYGNSISTTDARNVTTTLTYGCINGQASCQPSEQNLYPTKTESASNYASLKRTSTIEYDFSTGLPTASTDVDNNVRSETDYDALGRPEIQKVAVGTAQQAWTQFEYYVSPTSEAASSDWKNYVVTKADLFVKEDKRKVSTQFFDQLGRVRLTKTLEDAANQSATNETDGIKVQTRYLTSGNNTYQLTSNPYRAATLVAAEGEQTMGWTRTKTDNSGRHSETETFSGAALPAPFAASTPNTISTGVVMTDADSDRTMVTDQSGKKRISKTNAFGKLVNVWEIKEQQDADTETITFGNNPQQTFYGLKTSYLYDALDNLKSVTQGTQPQRIFSYSSLSRLLSADNPESGLVSYEYDANGNLKKKTDARLVVTNYTYDELNRVKTRTYSAPQNLVNYQASLPAAYEYDGVENAKGKLTKVLTGDDPQNPFSVTDYQEFDKLGRVTKSQQMTGGTIPDPMTYVYNLAGDLTEEKYPSGRVVKNILDEDGDLSIVQSKKNANSIFWNHARRFTYTASGEVSQMQLGNGNWEITKFNSRLQPTQIAFGITQNQPNLLKLDYTYNTPNTADNNGNVKTQIISFPVIGVAQGFSAVQTYIYDSLDRLKQADEKPSGYTQAQCDSNPSQCWKQTYDYDRFGNRRFDEAPGATTTLTRGCPVSVDNPHGICNQQKDNPHISVSKNNRFRDYGYDAAGNMTSDAESKQYIYDGENRQTEVKASSGLSLGKYYYDADGRRVKKTSATETVIFVYDAEAKLVAEYSTQVSQNPQVSYLTTDALGSPRIKTDANGQVISRNDYLPFGEELSTLQRTQAIGYKSDSIRRKFTTYKRDEETGLDFAEARYYAPKWGRFTSPDEFTGGPDELFDFEEDAADNPTFYADLENPQSLNKYIYTYNNPLNLTDSDGHCPICLLLPRPIVAPRPVVAPRPFPGGPYPLFPIAPNIPLEQQVEAPYAPPINPGPVQIPDDRPRPIERRKTPYRPVEPRNVGRRSPSRKQAEERSRSRGGNQRPRPTPKKNNPDGTPNSKRTQWEKARKWKKPERHPDSRHPDPHFHTPDKGQLPERRPTAPGHRPKYNPHDYFPK